MNNFTPSQRTQRYRARQVAKGLCATGCKRPLFTKVSCLECRNKFNTKNSKKTLLVKRELIAKGLCSRSCGRPLGRGKWYCDTCLPKISEASKKSYYKNHEANKKRLIALTHKYRFGGLRPQVVERDNHQCQVCKYDKKVRVHHINEDSKDNRLENLICLCIICHTVVERINANKPNLLTLFPWFKP